MLSITVFGRSRTPSVLPAFPVPTGRCGSIKTERPSRAHGGQVQKFTHNGVTKWYWYGEDKTDGYRTVDGGVRVYSSTDLYNWADEGIALRNLTDEYDFEEDYFHALYGDYTEEQRARVLLASQ